MPPAPPKVPPQGVSCTLTLLAGQSVARRAHSDEGVPPRQLAPGCPSRSKAVRKPLVLWYSVLFMVQLSHPYMTTGKTIALTLRTYIGKAMSLLFNMLSRVVIAFIPRNKYLLISWPQSLSTVILEPKKIKYILCVTKSLCRTRGINNVANQLYFNKNK